MMHKFDSSKLSRLSLLSVVFVFMISGVIFADNTTIDESTDSATGVTTFKQVGYTSDLSDTEEKLTLIPISRKSYLKVMLKASYELGCNTKVYFQRKKKDGSTSGFEVLEQLDKSSGTDTVTTSWTGDVDPTTYDYYIYTYAHKLALGYSNPSATVEIYPYFELTYEEMDGQGAVNFYKNGSHYVSIASGDLANIIEYLAGDQA